MIDMPRPCQRCGLINVLIALLARLFLAMNPVGDPSDSAGAGTRASSKAATCAADKTVSKVNLNSASRPCERLHLDTVRR